MVTDGLKELGEFIREQREQASVSVRKLAERAGISNPYLSQIERGLRKPSAEILKAIARGLSIQAESLYVRAGLIDESERVSVLDVLSTDPALTVKQRQALTEIYETFLRSNKEET